MTLEIEPQNLLAKLVIENQDLEYLESILSEFNIFKAIGMDRQEIRHSYFLAFLLNPSENHRLGDLFLKKFLTSILLRTSHSVLNPINIDIANLEDTIVKREWKNIDILIYSPSNNFICIIENKVDSLEHSNQLERYTEIINREFPSYQKMFLFLTKEGTSASHENWLSVSYGEISNLLETICKKYQSTLGNNIQTLMLDYMYLIRRYIIPHSEIDKISQKIYKNNSQALNLIYQYSLNESSDEVQKNSSAVKNSVDEEEIAQLCQKIYVQHQEALDIIYEHSSIFLPKKISKFIQELIVKQTEHNLTLETKGRKKYTRFSCKEWNELNFPKSKSSGWGKHNPSLLFEVVFDESSELRLYLSLTVAPSDVNFKQSVFDAVRNCDISGVIEHQFSENGWQHIYEKEILNQVDYLEEDIDILKNKIICFWEEHIKGEIKIIRQAIYEKFSS